MTRALTVLIGVRSHMQPYITMAGRFPPTDYRELVENRAHNVALHFMHYNFCRIHQTLRVTPAMEAGITDHQWRVEELLA